MKSWVILTLPWLVMSLTWTWTSAGTGELTDTSFESCEPFHWVLKNRIVQWNNDSKHISISATYKEPGSPIYTMYIVIDKCKNNTSCNGTPKIWVQEVNCSANNLTESDKKICQFAMEMGKWELQDNWLQDNFWLIRFGLLPPEEIYKWMCFYIEDSSLSYTFDNNSNYVGDDSSSNSSNESK